jgi:alpha-L-fucosidase
MFIHWGLYSLAARHEWLKHRDRLTDADYQKYFDHFYPDLYDPEQWAEEARNAGMKYFVITTKHHEGFCLWDSALTEYKATRTPWGKDLIAPMVEAFRQQGLRVGFYHSLIDWHNPDFTIDGLHPRRDDEEFKKQEAGRDMARYRAYLHGQSRELLTRFGDVAVIWYDFSYRDSVWGGKGSDDWGAEELLAMTRELQPGILVNDRLEIGGDFVTPEQWQPYRPLERGGRRVVWEACQTLTGSWGHDRDNQDWKPAGMLIRMLVDTVSKDGNMLLNVGPTARGELDPRAVERLRAIGAWMHLHNRSIYGCGPADLTPPPDCRYTQSGNRLYLHLFSWPFRHVHLEGLAGRVEYAQLLNDASEILWSEGETGSVESVTIERPPGAVTLELPVQAPPVEVPVVELFLRT